MNGVFRKIGDNCLVPVDIVAKKLISSLKMDEGYILIHKKVRNIRFHRKFFSLLKLAYDAWEPVLCVDRETGEIIGKPIKDFGSFREEILVLAGYCDQVFSVTGDTFKLKAKSISFDKCTEEEFQIIYGNVKDVIWENVLTSYANPEVIEKVANELLRYD